MTYLITHANCFDGGAAMYILRQAFNAKTNPDVHCIYASYGNRLPELTPDNIIIADFSYPVGQLQALLKEHDVTLIDHHESALVEGLKLAGTYVTKTKKFKLVEALSGTGENQKKLKLGKKELTPLATATNDIIEDFIDAHELTRLHFQIKDGHQLDFFLDTTRCGAYLCWERYFPKEPIPNLLMAIDDRDRWVWQQPNTRAIMAGWSQMLYEHETQLITQEMAKAAEELQHPLHSWLPLDVSTLEYSARMDILNMIPERIALADELYAKWFNQENLEALIAQSVEKEAQVEAAIEQALKTVQWCYFLEDWVPIVMTDKHQSMIGHALLDKYPQANHSLTYRMDANDSFEFSVRSRAGVRGNRLAAMLGGGGHPGASGFKFLKFRDLEKDVPYEVPNFSLANQTPIGIRLFAKTEGFSPLVDADTYVFVVKQ